MIPFSSHVIEFNKSLNLDITLPKGVVVMNPFEDRIASQLSSEFYTKYYNDTHKRKLILGINPGRLGGGVTGIPFTDPVKLQNNCTMPNDLKKVTEPSAGFIYDMIEAYGGPELFYTTYFIYAVCPLGFTREGVNYNYYDSKELAHAVTPFIISSMNKILDYEVDSDICYCLGNGKNYKFLTKLNEQERFFGKVVPLPHPRWIVQYRRKRYNDFIREYLKVLK